MKTFSKYIVEARDGKKDTPPDITRNFINFSDSSVPDYKYSFNDFHAYYGDNQSFLFGRGNYNISGRIDMAKLKEIIDASKIYSNYLNDKKKTTKELERKYGGERNIEKEYGAWQVYFKWQYEGIDKHLKQINDHLPLWKNMYNIARMAGRNAKKFEYEDDVVELYDTKGNCVYKGVYDNMNSELKRATDDSTYCPLLNMYVLLQKLNAIKTVIGGFLIVRK